MVSVVSFQIHPIICHAGCSAGPQGARDDARAVAVDGEARGRLAPRALPRVREPRHGRRYAPAGYLDELYARGRHPTVESVVDRVGVSEQRATQLYRLVGIAP